nr:DUF2785 domain-containing protein [Macrococcus equipercicus]
MKECLDNLTYRINEKNNDNVFKRSFSALFLHAIVYSDNQEKFLSEMEYNVLIKGSIDYFINEKDVRGFVDGKGWAHAPAHTSDLIVECIKSQYYMKNFNGEILEGIEINLARLQNDYIPYIDDEEMRMSHIVIELLEKSLVTEQYIVDWIKLIKNKLETTKVKDIIYYRKAKNLNDFIKSLYFGAKNHPVLQKMLITLIES